MNMNEYFPHKPYQNQDPALQGQPIGTDYPIHRLDTHTAATLAAHYEQLASQLRAYAETKQPAETRRITTQAIAKQIKEASWEALRLESDGLDKETALDHASRKFGIPQWQLAQTTETHRLGMRNHHRQRRNQEIIQMLAGGYTQYDVALRFNVSQSTVCRIHRTHRQARTALK
ncbi:helix-turn-helix domain-containing protein [Magnetococcus sp. PR-3]|uniref:helix-turn-helix domain-containing protein n=1 Tax=Magnetococcus sp. PR-3 TaxID=3120355 RepID=UPI003FA54791